MSWIRSLFLKKKKTSFCQLKVVARHEIFPGNLWHTEWWCAIYSSRRIIIQSKWVAIKYLHERTGRWNDVVNNCQCHTNKTQINSVSVKRLSILHAILSSFRFNCNTMLIQIQFYGWNSIFGSKKKIESKMNVLKQVENWLKSFHSHSKPIKFNLYVSIFFSLIIFSIFFTERERERVWIHSILLNTTGAYEYEMNVCSVNIAIVINRWVVYRFVIRNWVNRFLKKKSTKYLIQEINLLLTVATSPWNSITWHLFV